MYPCVIHSQCGLACVGLFDLLFRYEKYIGNKSFIPVGVYLGSRYMFQKLVNYGHNKHAAVLEKLG